MDKQLHRFLQQKNLHTNADLLNIFKFFSFFLNKSARIRDTKALLGLQPNIQFRNIFRHNNNAVRIDVLYFNEIYVFPFEAHFEQLDNY